MVIDVVVIWIAAWLDPGQPDTGTPTWFWALFATLLIILLSAFAEAVLGVDDPGVDVSDRQRAVWHLLDRLPTPRRSAIVENLRLMQVYETISSVRSR